MESLKNDLYVINTSRLLEDEAEKGLYNKYVLSKMELIEELLSSNQGSLESKYVREHRLSKLAHYFIEVREKLTKTFNRILTAEEKRRLKELADIIKLSK